ncbi:MAG: endonuclease III [Elusimicrobiota bacterium]
MPRGIRKKSLAARRGRAARIVSALAKAYPRADCALAYSNALQLLVATILSAQCTDERVNKVSGPLFARYRSAADFAGAELADLEALIHSTGFFRHKARNIRETCRIIVERHGGEVPGTMEALLELPGVARKTANVVLGTWFGKTEGVVVDTHVLRLSGRLGLSRREDPVKVEEDLMALLPREGWTSFSHRMILHGRRVCKALRPLCEDCPLSRLCPSAGKAGK